ncbi:MAG: hypothetical protein FWD73_04050 [Polyangiaceae bacterium]|nr:hypothetical protein [Polyangiaceae bacterium]
MNSWFNSVSSRARETFNQAEEGAHNAISKAKEAVTSVTRRAEPPPLPEPSKAMDEQFVADVTAMVNAQNVAAHVPDAVLGPLGPLLNSTPEDLLRKIPQYIPGVNQPGSLAERARPYVMGAGGLVTGVATGQLGPEGAMVQQAIDATVDRYGTKDDKFAFGVGQAGSAAVLTVEGLAEIGGGGAGEVTSGGTATAAAVPVMAHGVATLGVATAHAVGAVNLIVHGLVSTGSPATGSAPATEPSKSAEAEAPVKASSPTTGPSKADVVKPSRSPDANAVPRGHRATFNSRDDAEKIRGITRENEAADTLAKNGYDVEQRPQVPGRKKPDYKIEGEIFDCHAPKTETNTRSVYSHIKQKVDNKQADRIVLNLDDWGGNVESMRKQLTDYPIKGLKEVKIVRSGSVVDLYP